MTTLEAQHEVITNLILENQKLMQERDYAKELRDGDKRLIEALAEDVGIKISCNPKFLGVVWEQFHDGVLELKRERDEARNEMADALQEVDLRILCVDRMNQECYELRKELERERDELREELRTAVQERHDFHWELLDAIQERDELRKELEEYRSIAENIGAVKAVSEKEKAIRERDEFRDVLSEISLYLSVGMGDETTTSKQYYDRILEGIKMLTDPIVENWKKTEKECDKMRGALMAIEDRCVDCEDACDDIQKIRDIAREALEK